MEKISYKSKMQPNLSEKKESVLDKVLLFISCRKCTTLKSIDCSCSYEACSFFFFSVKYNQGIKCRFNSEVNRIKATAKYFTL